MQYYCKAQKVEVRAGGCLLSNGHCQQCPYLGKRGAIRRMFRWIGRGVFVAVDVVEGNPPLAIGVIFVTLIMGPVLCHWLIGGK